MPDNDTFNTFVRAATATTAGGDAENPRACHSACPTNRRMFLQRSLGASIAAGLLGASNKSPLGRAAVGAAERSSTNRTATNAALVAPQAESPNNAVPGMVPTAQEK